MKGEVSVMAMGSPAQREGGRTGGVDSEDDSSMGLPGRCSLA